ncbi:MAG: hypothetical protein DRP47_02080 [Candidatus Zixiibacteriota bacterium]|nr:MAG: hypothetical protein DRP47_02080 [candidate division Zixibacteria bacterium]
MVSLSIIKFKPCAYSPAISYQRYLVGEKPLIEYAAICEGCGNTHDMHGISQKLTRATSSICHFLVGFYIPAMHYLGDFYILDIVLVFLD